MSHFASIMVKAAGAIMFVFGAGLASLVAWMAVRQFADQRAPEPGIFATLSIPGVVAGFCALVGYRLLFNRPNRRGSALSPVGWMILAGILWITGLVLAVGSVMRGAYGELLGTACAAAIGYLCLQAARNASIEPISPKVLPPETSLIGIEGFMPAGFQCGIEILNDNQTPMEFVVTMLRDMVGMPEPDAVRVMLDIHQKGGVLLATSTPEEASRIAHAITSEARGGNHPLVCRPVTAPRADS